MLLTPSHLKYLFVLPLTGINALIADCAVVYPVPPCAISVVPATVPVRLDN